MALTELPWPLEVLLASVAEAAGRAHSANWVSCYGSLETLRSKRNATQGIR
jgi:hypothetical protein